MLYVVMMVDHYYHIEAMAFISHTSNSIPKLFLSKWHYEGGKKYCRRGEVYYCHDGMFCPCCGMALRTSPTSKRDNERLRQLQLLREGEQDRIFRVIKGIKK